MKLRNFLLAWGSLIKKILSPYFSTKIIIKAFVGAILISNFILADVLGGEILNFISPFFAIAGFYFLLKFDRRGFFWTGFFIGIIWFYWISFSLVYYELSYLIPLEILAIGIIYGALFLIAGIPAQIWLKALLLILVSNIHPFGFNWLNLEAVFVPGIFAPSLLALAFIFAAILSLFYVKNCFKFIAFAALLACAVQYGTPNFKTLPFEVKLANTEVEQELKWQKQLKNEFINQNLAIIDEAINDGFRAVILPESAFPVYMTHERNLISELLEKSQKIAIVAGALARENGTNYNSAFFFDRGKVRRLDKFILVPFGEEIPLPAFARDLINKIFFGGAKDFETASAPSDYEIDGVKIRNAICYEATRDELFEGEFDVMIAVTNNGWFVPSTESFLQRNLIKYYATKYNKAIYHSVNGSPSEIITPKQGLLDKFFR